MIALLSIICIVFGILQIILFFKIWGMTNDIKKIRSMTNLNNRLAFFGKLPPPKNVLISNLAYTKSEAFTKIKYFVHVMIMTKML